MSNGTGLSISRSSNTSPVVLLATGLSAAAVQLLFLREYFSIFSGNELTIAIVFSIWLTTGAAGSLAGKHFGRWRNDTGAVVFITAMIAGLLGIRSIRLMYLPGEIIPSVCIPFFVILSGGPVGFLCGYVFGVLSRLNKGRVLFRLENYGAIAGLCIISIGQAMQVSNTVLLLICCLPFLIFTRKSLISCAVCLLLIAGLVSVAHRSVQWKYGSTPVEVKYGHEGELAFGTGAQSGTVLLNGMLYKTDYPVPSIEQAVHVPMSLRSNIKSVLVVRNCGHMDQLEKYDGLNVECIEPEPLLTGKGCLVGNPEQITSNEAYDLILLGTGFPETVASNRFFTVSFFRQMYSHLSDSGLFSFSLPFNENYLSPQEKRMRDLVVATLKSVFTFVKVYPGYTFTFVASRRPFGFPRAPVFKTYFYEPVFLASLTPGRIERAGLNDDDKPQVNTIGRPYALVASLDRWVKMTGARWTALVPILVIIVSLMAFAPRSSAAVSVGSSGFVCGAYTILLLLLFQSCYGTLYSKIAALMIVLAVGFVCGSYMKRFPFSDPVIGIFAAVTLLILSGVSYPPYILFLLFHLIMGFLVGAQFSTRKVTDWGGLNAVDLFGGVFGMGLGGTLLIPLLGVQVAAASLAIIKLLSWSLCLKAKH